jgi:hypothetical protein
MRAALIFIEKDRKRVQSLFEREEICIKKLAVDCLSAFAANLDNMIDGIIDEIFLNRCRNIRL